MIMHSLLLRPLSSLQTSKALGPCRTIRNTMHRRLCQLWLQWNHAMPRQSIGRGFLAVATLVIEMLRLGPWGVNMYSAHGQES